MKALMLRLMQPFKSLMLPTAGKNDIDALQNFAITMAIAFPVIFMGVLPWLVGTNMPAWPAALSILLMLLYIFVPKALYGPYLIWMVIASILGWINTKIILALAYYLLIVPTGLLMRSLKKLQYRHYEPTQSSWVKREKLPTKENLKEPF
jgi:hypothetical protein